MCRIYSCIGIVKDNMDNEMFDASIDNQVKRMIIMRLVIILMNSFKLFVLLKKYALLTCIDESIGYIIYNMTIHILIIMVKLSTFLCKGKSRRYLQKSRYIIFTLSNSINFTTLRWIDLYNDIYSNNTTCNIIIHLINSFVYMVDITLFFNTLQCLTLQYLITSLN